MHALDEGSPARGKKSQEKKPGRKRKATPAKEQVENQPEKSFLAGRGSNYRLLAENVSDVIWGSDIKGNLL